VSIELQEPGQAARIVNPPVPIGGVLATNYEITAEEVADIVRLKPQALQIDLGLEAAGALSAFNGSHLEFLHIKSTRGFEGMAEAGGANAGLVLPNLPNLKSFKMTSPEVPDEIVSVLVQKAPQLEGLSLGDTAVQGSAPPQVMKGVDQLQHLESLYLAGFVKMRASEIAALSNLVSLRIGNGCLDRTDGSIHELATISGLRRLEIETPQFPQDV